MNKLKIMKHCFMWCIVSSILFLCSLFLFSGMNNAHVNAESVTIKQAYQRLNQNSKKIYDVFKVEIDEIINGQDVKAYFSLSESELKNLGLKTQWTSTELNKQTVTYDDIKELFFKQFDSKLVMQALIHDMPYELFWFDKVTGIIHSVTISGNSESMKIASLKSIMSVSNDYSPTTVNASAPTVDQTKINNAKTAITKATGIVEKYKNLSDYQKLIAYKNEICDMVEYHDQAASGLYFGGYGNPWQVIHVFDDNNATKVVCEGYAKAFQLLCNLTTFNSNIICYTVSGVMNGATGSGDHMWNVVVMDDEKSYLVDVTNSDSGTVGFGGGLFLSGYKTKTASNDYIFNVGGQVTFSYSDSTKALWGNLAQNVLDISNTDYQEDHETIKITQNQNLTYDGQAVKAGLIGTQNIDITYSFEGALDENLYDWEVEFYQSLNGLRGEKLNSEPINAGEYFIKVIATNKTLSTDVISTSQKIIIFQKVLTVESVEVLDKTYNGMTLVEVSKFNLSGVINDDNVYVKSNAVANTISANAGKYSKVNLNKLKIDGDDSLNYIIFESMQDVPSNEFNVNKKTPAFSTDFGDVVGKTLQQIDFEVIAKGVNNTVVNGSFVWVDEQGEQIDLNQKIEKAKKYYYKFTPTDSNYCESIQSVVLWTTYDNYEEEKEQGKQQKVKTYLIYGGIAILVFGCYTIFKKKKKS